MAIVIDELTPEEVWERFQNSYNYRTSFSIEGIGAIFEYFENIEIDHEYESFDLIGWHSTFYEEKTPEKLLKAIEPEEYKEIEKNYSEKNIRDKCMEFIENNYDWYKYLDNGGVIVYYPR